MKPKSRLASMAPSTVTGFEGWISTIKVIEGQQREVSGGYNKGATNPTASNDIPAKIAVATVMNTDGAAALDSA